MAFITLNFQVYQGWSKQDLLTGQDLKTKRNDGSLQMDLTNQQTFFVTTLKIGSNQDENLVLVDTGSSDLWVMSHDLTCVSPGSISKRYMETFGVRTGVRLKNKKNKDSNSETGPIVYTTQTETESNDCTTYGTFNTENSDTFSENNTIPFLIEYADNTHAIGIWGHDNVIINDVTVRNLSFAIANESSSEIGVLGIGLPTLQVTSLYGYIYENLPIKLVSDGIIGKAIYSIYLNAPNAETGTVLFGAIDRAKYQDNLVTFNMMKTRRSNKYPSRIQIPVSKIDYVTSNGGTSNIFSSSRSGHDGVVLDTGSTLSYVFSDVLDSISEAVHGQYSSSIGAYVVDCNLLNSKDVVNIEFGGSKTIKVPVSNLIIEIRPSQCILGVLPQSTGSSYMLFGINIIRNAYIVIDVEDYQVSLAQVYFTNKESIEVIGQEGLLNTTNGSTTSDAQRLSIDMSISKLAYGFLVLSLTVYCLN
ncbi:SAP9 Candidapepsin-9 [Candida maltosa Xu316]